MGLPVRSFVAASNANDVVPEYLQTAVYRPRPSVRTVANAMDVGDPSNFERMMWLCGDSYDALKSELEGFSCTDSQIKGAIKEIYDSYGYISDPHSAVGYLAAKAFEVDGFWLSTAHAAKFCEVIKDSIGLMPELPEGLAQAMEKPKKSTPVSAEEAVLAEYLCMLA